MGDKPKTIPEILRRLEELEEDLAHYKVRMDGLQVQITEQTKNLQTLLEQGDTTGDRLQDLVFRAHGHTKEWPVLAARYRALEEKLKGKKREFVLLSFPEPYNSLIPSDRLYTREYYRIGVLQAEQLSFAENVLVTLPVHGYIQGELNASIPEDGYLLVKEDIFSFATAAPPLLSHHMVKDNPQDGLEIHIGNEAVKKWMEPRFDNPEEAYKEALAALFLLPALEPAG